MFLTTWESIQASSQLGRGNRMRRMHEKFCLFLFCFCILLAAHPGEVTHLSRYLSWISFDTGREAVERAKKGNTGLARTVDEIGEREEERTERAATIIDSTIRRTDSIDNILAELRKLVAEGIQECRGRPAEDKTLETTITVSRAIYIFGSSYCSYFNPTCLMRSLHIVDDREAAYPGECTTFLEYQMESARGLHGLFYFSVDLSMQSSGIMTA